MKWYNQVGAQYLLQRRENPEKKLEWVPVSEERTEFYWRKVQQGGKQAIHTRVEEPVLFLGFRIFHPSVFPNNRGRRLGKMLTQARGARGRDRDCSGAQGGRTS